MCPHALLSQAKPHSSRKSCNMLVLLHELSGIGNCVMSLSSHHSSLSSLYPTLWIFAVVTLVQSVLPFWHFLMLPFALIAADCAILCNLSLLVTIIHNCFNTLTFLSFNTRSQLGSYQIFSRWLLILEALYTIWVKHKPNNLIVNH